ncbi:hypothetical protein [Haloarcula sp. Atlit-7R]|uniref:DUF7139 domain-containing protein n=1 Tax=Haloarcula sp. Atlit-7R TaxID=2282125 RepID=UPI000EF14EC3|nr:hypothetical protein [Haloarcula sp. Atlit-7R]RLN01393.1 hypothetical protein D3D01_00825 [Haloarcula sp. Atlit-7R]
MVVGLSESMATEKPDNMLLDCYQRYIGSLEAVSEVDVYAGAGLTMGGLLLTVVGWGVFLWNETATYGTSQFYTVRELAIVAAGLGIPVFVLGAVAMLLGSHRTTAVAIGGTAICSAAVLLFVTTYPSQWDAPGRFNAPIGVSLYGLGLSAMLFAFGAAYSCRMTGKV